MRHHDYPIEAAAEIVFDEKGDLLWIERYCLSAIHRKGDWFIRDYKEYEVLESALTIGKHRGALVEHVVRLKQDRTPHDRTES